MSSMMSVVIAGHLGQDPELKVTSGGVPMCTFSVAVDRPYRNQSGERVTDWIAVRAWRGVAEACKNHLRKGSFAIVNGRMESYVKELVLEGGEVYRSKSWTLVADTVTFGPKSGPSSVIDDDDEPEPEAPPAKPAATTEPATKKPATRQTKAVRSE